MLLSKIEAAMKLSISVELLNYFTKKCPKQNGTRLLQTVKAEEQIVFDDQELLSYQNYLNEPWPYAKESRPPLPDAIKNDIKAESHYGCAICGYSDNGEVAHIEAVADSLNNSPDNLIFLCPNHHTKYDLGYRPKSNITRDVIQAAKLLKRATRLRMMRHEANAMKLFGAVTSLLKNLKKNLEKSGVSAQMVEVYMTETKSLMQQVPGLAAGADEAAKADNDLSDVDGAIARIAPKLVKATSGAIKSKEDSAIRTALSTVVDTVDDALLDFDEVECPHCHGAGMTGLVGDLCVYCKGECFVSSEEAEEYDLEEIDQVECPRCGGRGTVGWAGAYCPFCRGSCAVSSERAEEFDENNLPEKQCPHCRGTGTRGLVGDLCPYCKGDTFVSDEKFEAYDADAIDEVDCPHCHGAGITGLVQNFCAYCRGSQLVTREKRKKYEHEKIDEVECPHCHGTGLRGRGEYCAYCRGSQVVSQEKNDAYDPNDFDEEKCPRCNGSGQTGLVSSECALCKGDGFVTEATAKAYRNKFG
jgi:DnaJ-class molecular chaperone